MEFMTFKPTVDGTMRLVSVLIVGVLLIAYSTVFEVEYSQKLIQLYMYPWWRVLLVLLVLCASLWCPRVAIVVALAVFFYLGDIHTLLTPFASTEKAYP
jgi:hypothetical protein